MKKEKDQIQKNVCKASRKLKAYLKGCKTTKTAMKSVLMQIAKGKFSGPKSKLPKLVKLCIKWGLASKQNNSLDKKVSITFCGGMILNNWDKITSEK